MQDIEPLLSTLVSRLNSTPLNDSNPSSLSPPSYCMGFSFSMQLSTGRQKKPVQPTPFSSLLFVYVYVSFLSLALSFPPLLFPGSVASSLRLASSFPRYR
ncbi:hypothetical protein P154DRAFT_526709 [Amniculicola lignicola CBS 123094]|uniref:Uncharacterized protein n=1 Tax=Amniculicola lignicola CBS 123094 TaxID=1392246 RepID=A0A6A5W138_9PLEO|nr:hypothetical protein P154DRAFT_526709 [Amniculicola lignicola CBS 123094]